MAHPHTGILITALALSCISSANAQRGGPRPGPTFDWSQVEQRIAWYGTVSTALEAAERTGRPILVMSAQPHCRGTPGIW